jgi:hypothetical protein
MSVRPKYISRKITESGKVLATKKRIVKQSQAPEYFLNKVKFGISRAAGTREDRIKKTLINIGPAVFNGGLTTSLAFVLLGSILRNSIPAEKFLDKSYLSKTDKFSCKN